jgi:Na+/proline symporter
MIIYVWELAGIAAFYIVMLGVGIWAGRKQKYKSEEEKEVMLDGRNIDTIVGVLTFVGLWLCLSPVFLEYTTFV